MASQTKGGFAEAAIPISSRMRARRSGSGVKPSTSMPLRITEHLLAALLSSG